MVRVLHEKKMRIVNLSQGLSLLEPYVQAVDPFALCLHHEYVVVSGVVDLPEDVAHNLRMRGWGPWSDVDPDGLGQTWGYSTC